MRDYRSIPLGVIPSDKKDSRQFTYDMFVDKGALHYSKYPQEVKPKLKITARDQGQTSMCFAFAEARVLEVQNYIETGILEKVSEGYIYYRKDLPQSEGMLSLWELENIRKKGAVLESDFKSFGTWSQINEHMKDYDADALAIKANELRAVSTLGLLPEHIPAYLAHHYGGIITIDVYDTFYSVGADGIYEGSNGLVNGGHGMYFDSTEIINGKLGVWVMNSWGTEWGKAGRVWIDLEDTCIKSLYGVVDVTPITNEVVFLVGRNTMYTSKGEVEIPVAPEYKYVNGQGYAMLPMRALAEALGRTVTWQRSSDVDRIAFIIDPKVYAMLYLDNEDAK